MHPTRRNFWRIAIPAATFVVIVLLVLIGLRVLVLPASAPPKVTVTEIVWTIEQGVGASGIGWFGPSQRVSNASSGLPIQIASGGKFVATLSLSDLDTVNHTIKSVTAVSPFQVTSSAPPVPANVISGMDDFVLSVTVEVPSVSSDASYTVNLIVNTV